MNAEERKRDKVKSAGRRAGLLFGLCPAAHALLFFSLLVTAAFFILRSNTDLMTLLSENYVRAYHKTFGRIFGFTELSVAEMIVAVFISAILIYVIRAIVLLFLKKNKLRRLYKTVVILSAAAATVYAGFCLLWGVNYYARGFPESAGIEAKPVSAKELETLTRYFAGIANEYAPLVAGDTEGRFRENETLIFEKSASLYDNTAAEYRFLAGPALRVKPMKLSYFMSYVNFTGFFFPFTGEASVNTDSPQCLLPATIAHEIAHQRGVAAEDEANFTAVLSCMMSDEPEYRYSASLLAYIHLGNALFGADRDAWTEIYGTLDYRVRADLEENREYWAKFDTRAAKVTEAVYSEFLRNYGQESGMKSYGACVDLLVAYYKEEAEAQYAGAAGK